MCCVYFISLGLDRDSRVLCQELIGQIVRHTHWSLIAIVDPTGLVIVSG